MSIATGLSRPHENRELAHRVRSLWQAEEARRGGQLWALHVKGHSSSKWNQQADRGAARGAQGFVRGVGHRWASWPPLPSRKPRAHEISMSQRVMRATHAFGVLAIPVPVSGEAVTQATLDASLACVEGALSREHGPQSSVALQRARASHLLLSDSSRQRAEAGRLIAEGMQPVTSEVMCPVNGQALRKYVREAPAEADAMQFDKRGRPRGTLREIARQFLQRLGRRTAVTIAFASWC